LDGALTNVWLALTWPAHSHHQHAVQYWEQQAAPQVLFCTVTALGLVRLVCQPKLMGTAVRNAAEASALLEALCQQPGVRLAKPEHNGWRLVSFDRDFERFAGLERLLLP
jgi:predicted nucleic acid-binding protein